MEKTMFDASIFLIGIFLLAGGIYNYNQSKEDKSLKAIYSKFILAGAAVTVAGAVKLAIGHVI